jgi:hypothetical protein
MVCTHRRRHLAFRFVCEISLAYEPPPILADNQGQSDLVWRRLRRPLKMFQQGTSVDHGSGEKGEVRTYCFI